MNTNIASQQRARVEEFQRTHRIGLLTLLFTDLVGSTKLKQELGDHEAVALIQRYRGLVREILSRFKEGEEIETAGDSFFIVFAKPSDAVQFSLILQSKLRALAGEAARPLLNRIGLHVGEVVIEERPDSPKPKDLYGLQVDICARVMSLAEGDQILMTRSAFDNARQILKGREIEGVKDLSWLNHGPYLLKGVEEPLEICEVGETGEAILKPPPDSEKVHRFVAPDSEPVLGWRPALGQKVAQTPWVLEEKLGEGGFGEVWLAKHEVSIERRVFKFCFRADRVRSLKREATLIRSMKERFGQHPHIVGLKGVYFDQPPFYLEMEYVEGRDLASWAKRRGGLKGFPLRTRLEIVAQVADALDAAHEAGVLHRDVKPANILIAECGVRSAELGSLGSEVGNPKSDFSQPSTLNPQPSAKLTDFGIGQVVSADVLAGMTRAGFTQTIGATVPVVTTGTQLYMAPELLAGQPASAQSDIYSLGVVLYQLCVGDFSRPLTMDWPKGIEDVRLREVLAKCFAGDLKERFATGGEMAKALRSYERPRAVLDSKSSLPRWLWAAAAAVTVLLAVTFLVLVRRRTDDAGRSWARPSVSAPAAAAMIPATVSTLSAGELLKIAYAGAPPIAAPQAALPQLQFEVLGKRQGQADFQFLRDGDALRSEVDDYVIVLRALSASYVYVFQVDTLGSKTWLFPQNPSSDFSSGANPVAAGQTIRVPSGERGRALYLDRNTGVEHVYAVLSAAAGRNWR